MTLDRQLNALANETRRRLLISLATTASEQGQPVIETAHLDSDQRLVLRHVHLPKLVASGYVVWDSATGRVGRGPAFEDLRPLLSFLADGPESGSEPVNRD